MQKIEKTGINNLIKLKILKLFLFQKLNELAWKKSTNYMYQALNIKDSLNLV